MPERILGLTNILGLNNIVGLTDAERARPCGEYLEALPWEPPPDPDFLTAGAFLDLL